MIINMFFMHMILKIILFLTSFILLFDPRFKLFNRILISSLIILLIIVIDMLLGVTLPVFLRDIFWYSLILNGSFIIHTLYLNWIFYLCREYRWEYLGFLVTRLSWLLSLSFFSTKIYIFHDHLCKNADSYGFIKGRIRTILINKIFLIVFLVLNFFHLTFINYNLMLMGHFPRDKFTVYGILYFFSFFLITIVISFYILGIPRLFVSWFFMCLLTLVHLFIKYKRQQFL